MPLRPACLFIHTLDDHLLVVEHTFLAKPKGFLEAIRQCPMASANAFSFIASVPAAQRALLVAHPTIFQTNRPSKFRRRTEADRMMRNYRVIPET